MRKAYLLLLAMLFGITSLLAQQTVSGKITDANGQPLSGVTIKSKKTGKTAITAADGTFSIQAAADDQLEITSVGFVSRTVPATGTIA
ncbi:MAG: carboxypeptidase-like regulatory domain-containing protein, partial [Chitinophagaceae bacterium]|nr:carboxypeptidase-like regulatory domain-containing protein [Chitinophagaceae bacterium]